MPDNYLSLADLTIINDNNSLDIEISDLFQNAPLLQVLSAVPASNGTVHKYYKTTTAPVVGFRSINDGREHDSTERTSVSIDLKILDASFTFDMAEANAYKGGAEGLLRLEAMEHLKAAYFQLEKQILGGTVGGSASGFAGLANSLNTAAKCINAGGTADRSSVYLIRSNPNEVAVVAGNGGLLEVGESMIQRASGSSVGHLPVYFTPISGWYGLQVGSSVKSIARICNLDATTKGVTDSMLYDAIATFEAGMLPNYIVMNRRSAAQLRKSRTATNATGAPAPWPTEIEGIPIIVTDAIGNAETALT
jgi:hypothetical protein